jgi:hypothetical protein
MACTPRTPPATVNDFKKRYAPRDFKFGDGPETVMDSDIDNAMTDAMAVFNPALFSPADGVVAFLALTAHYVRTNIEAVGGLQAMPEGLGVENQAEQILSGSGAIGVSQNFVEPPDWIKRFPLLQQLWITTYGQKYCAMVQPKLVGNVGVALGPIDAGAAGSPNVPFTDP